MSSKARVCEEIASIDNDVDLVLWISKWELSFYGASDCRRDKMPQSAVCFTKHVMPRLLEAIRIELEAENQRVTE